MFIYGHHMLLYIYNIHKNALISQRVSTMNYRWDMAPRITRKSAGGSASVARPAGQKLGVLSKKWKNTIKNSDYDETICCLPSKIWFLLVFTIKNSDFMSQNMGVTSFYHQKFEFDQFSQPKCVFTSQNYVLTSQNGDSPANTV